MNLLHFAGSSGCLTWVQPLQPQDQRYLFYQYQCVQYFHVSKHWYGCQCVWLLTFAKMMMHAIAYWSCVNTIRESALKVNSGRKCMPLLHWGIKPASVLRLVFGLKLYQLSYPAPSCWCRNVAWSGSKVCSGKMKFLSKWICSPTPHGKFCLWLQVVQCRMKFCILSQHIAECWNMVEDSSWKCFVTSQLC